MFNQMNNTVFPVRITPEVASRLLIRNSNNRSISQRKILEYADHMKNGRWKLNGETIKITEDGNILDGQHRLEACVKANITFNTYIVKVKDATSFDTIDIGKKRTGSDTLSVIGEKHTVILAAVLNMVAEYKYAEEIRERRFNISTLHIKELLRENPGIQDSVSYAVAKYNKIQRLISKTVLGFCHFILTSIDADEAENFLDRVVSGECLSKGSAELLLRNKLIAENRNSRGALPNRYVVALIFKAWNMKRLGKTGALLKFLDSETFPIPK